MSEKFVRLTGWRANGAVLIAGIVGVALTLGAGTAAAQVLGSQHDLSLGGGAQSTTGATTEVCVFCHTPHGANTGASAPLWNKTLPTTTYQRYSTLPSSTLDGGEAPVGSVSLACLSCHDGTQAMDVVINTPGSGGFNSGGIPISGGAIGVMVNPDDPANPGTPGPVPMLGTDLRDDHPISIQYGGGGCSATDVTCATLGDADFNTPATANINTVQAWWVNTAAGGGAGRQKQDMILYTRTDGPAAQEEPFVECGSCHDPHASTSTPVSFLRIDNTDSSICLACHTK
ncbi:MAG: hypothetical protein JSU95_10710 [Betaproteobacteria bacterium]|nr:MAG: hypothetical protein JSU95_10710 [Betaproteobacteria bacterium]